MSVPEYYPPADHTSQWKPNLAAGGSNWDHIEKLVLHSTEGKGWPGYPTFAPNLTYWPGHGWRQHLPMYRGGTTLMDPSSTSVRENRDFDTQVEIVGTAVGNGIDHALSANNDAGYKEIAKLAVWLSQFGLQLVSSVTWVPYPKSYGLHAAQRLSGPAFDAYNGILGHEHASGNEHGDPGWIDIKKLLSYAHPTPPKILFHGHIKGVKDKTAPRDNNYVNDGSFLWGWSNNPDHGGKTNQQFKPYQKITVVAHGHDHTGQQYWVTQYGEWLAQQYVTKD